MGETKPCRCCLAQGLHKDLNSTYSWMDQKENYANMLQDCFNIALSTSLQNSNGICDDCVIALRGACSFKQKVIRSEQELMGNVFIEIDMKPAVLKLEPKFDSDGDHSDECSLADAVREVQLTGVKAEPPAAALEGPGSRSRRGSRRPAAPGDCSSDVTRLLTRLNTIQNNGLTIKRKKVSKVANAGPCVVNFATKKDCNNMKNLSKAKSQGNAQKLLTVGPIKIMNKETQKSICINTSILQSGPKKTDSATKKHPFLSDRSMVDKHRSNIREVLLCSNGTLIRRGGLSYSCYFCSKHFPNPQKLKQHSLLDHDDTQRKTINFHELRRIITHLDITSLQCKLCNKNIDKIEELLAHLKNEHNREVHLDINNHIVPYKFDGDKLKCVVCGNEYFAFKKLQEHMNSHYSNYVCEYCSAGFVNFSRLYSHLTRHEHESLGQKFKCTLCPKTFATQARLKYHTRIHEGVNIKCAFCGQSFKDYKTRFKHLSEIHGVQFQTYDCHACDKSYNTASSLTIHIKRHHLVERNFACKECDLRFFSRQALLVHMVTHTGAKDFQCEICSKKFGRKKTLKEHLRIHLNDRRFECFHCGLSFVQKVSLRCHLRSKHSDKI